MRNAKFVLNDRACIYEGVFIDETREYWYILLESESVITHGTKHSFQQRDNHMAMFHKHTNRELGSIVTIGGERIRI